MLFERLKSKCVPNILKVLLWVAPVLFLIDNILGFNGYQFTIAGKSIRIILFAISVLVLALYCIAVMVKEKIYVFSKKEGAITIWKLLRPLDYVVLCFLLGNLLWATVIPLLIRGDMAFALKDFSCLLVLVLYFPVAFLIRTGRLNVKIIEKITYVLTIILAVWHCVMYIGDTICPGFYEGYYDFIDMISFGTAVRSSVIYGYGIVRIIQTTSLFLLLGIFLCIRRVAKGKWWHVIALLVFTFAICITYTKSIWFGYLAGLFLCLVPGIVINKGSKARIRNLVTLLISVLLIVVLNFVVFDNTIFERAFNTVRSEQSVEQMQETIDKLEAAGEDTSELKNKLKDALGTQQANSLRTSQNGALTEKWSQSRWLGYGYGAYVEDCIRNETYPYMYESTLPALMMKLGIVGMLMWLIFICGATISAVLTFKKEKKENLFCWLAIALSYAMAVQTNPFLFTFAGISMLLYLLIAVQNKTCFIKDKE